MSAYGRLKIQCLYVAGTMTECPLRRGVHSYGKLKMQCLCAAGTMTECPFRKGVCSWEVKNTVFVWLGPQLSVHLREVSAHGRLKIQCLYG